MRDVYIASVDISSVSAAKTLMYITAPATMCIELLEATVTNRSSSTSAQLEASLARITSLGTPTKSDLAASAVVKTEVGSANTSATVAYNVTASEPTYAANAIDKQGFNNLAGYRYDPLPEERAIIPPSATVGLKLSANPSASFDCTVQIVFREIG